MFKRVKEKIDYSSLFSAFDNVTDAAADRLIDGPCSLAVASIIASARKNIRALLNEYCNSSNSFEKKKTNDNIKLNCVYRYML